MHIPVDPTRLLHQRLEQGDFLYSEKSPAPIEAFDRSFWLQGCFSPERKTQLRPFLFEARQANRPLYNLDGVVWTTTDYSAVAKLKFYGQDETTQTGIALSYDLGTTVAMTILKSFIFADVNGPENSVADLHRSLRGILTEVVEIPLMKG